MKHKYAKIYALSTQGILNMVVLGGIGFGIGWLIKKNSVWPPILAVVGVLCGLVSFISYLIYLQKEDDKNNEKKSND